MPIRVPLIPLIPLAEIEIPRPRPRTEPRTEPRLRPQPRTPSDRVKMRRSVKALRAKVVAAEGTFFDAGAQLNKWKKAKSWRVLGHDNFKSFVAEAVMPYRTGARLMAIAAHYPKRQAMRLGIEKSYQLLRYAEHTGTDAKTLAAQDSKIGASRRRVSELSAEQIQGLTAALRLGAARQALPKPTREDKRVARAFERQFVDNWGVDPVVTIDKRRGVLRFEVPIDAMKARV